MDGKRNTLQRQLIWDAIRELNNHATAEQVYAHVVQSHPTVSKATVYKNLSQMSECGELLNIGNFFGAAHYDHNLNEHYHFVCDRCKRVFDVAGNFSEIISNLENADDFDVTRCNLSFGGLCKDCKQKTNDGNGGT